MTDDDIRRAAWTALLEGAESMAEDWMDEDGLYTNEESFSVFHTQMELLHYLRAMAPPKVTVPREAIGGDE